MIKEILNILKADKKLMALINGTAANPHIYPIETDYLGDCLVYDYHTFSADKITEAKRLEIVIIAKTLSKTLEIENELKRLILTLADKPLTTNILRVEINGGGSLYDNERLMNHRILYFDLISRSEV